MDKKQIIIWSAIIVAVILLGIVFEALLGGKDAGQNGDYKKPNTQTTEATTGETTEPDGTGGGDENGSGEGDNNQGDNNQGGGNQGGTTATEQGDIRIEIDDNGNLVIPTPSGNSSNNNNSGSSEETTDPTENTQEQQPTKPIGNNTELNFSDFFKP